MSEKEKYQICRKNFLKKADMLKLIGTNNVVFAKYWNEMIEDLEQELGHSFGPWGVPTDMCLRYFGISIERIKENADLENERGK